MEIKRLLSKKVLLAGVFILLFQAVAFIGNLIGKNEWGEQKWENKKYNQEIEELSQMPLDESLNISNERFASDKDTVTKKVADKLQYLAGYAESIQKILENAKKSEEFSIFQNHGSYAYANTRKTAEDFKKMEGISPGLDKDRVTGSLLKFPYISYYVCAFMMYAIYEMLKERDNGMWEITHTTQNGRSRIAWNRALALSTVAAGCYMLCFTVNFIIACLFYGTDDFGGFIQTLQEYARYPKPLSKGMYLCIYVFKSIIALIAAVMFMYLVFTALQRNLAVVALFGTFWVEWQLMRIPVYSNFKLLRYINMMNIFNNTSIEQEYQNLNILGNAVSASSVVFWAEILLAAACIGLAVFIYGRKYPNKTAWFDKLTTRVQKFMQRILAKFSLGAKEAYKILIAKRVLLFILLGVLAGAWAFNATKVYFPEAQRDMDDAYITYGGGDWDRFDSYVSQLTKEYEENLSKAQDIRNRIMAGTLGPESVPDAHIYENRAANIQIHLKEYNKKQELKRSFNRDYGIYAMSDRGYSQIIGPDSMLRETVIGIIVILLLVIAASHVFGYERRASTKSLLKISGKGITHVWKKKIICISCITGIILLLFYGLDYFALIREYEIPYLDAQIQSLTFFAENTARISIRNYIILVMGFKVTLSICAAASVLVISSDERTKNEMYLPILAVLYSALYVIIMLSQTVWLMMAASVVFVILTEIFIALSYKKWCI